MYYHQYFFGGKYDLIELSYTDQLYIKMMGNEKFIETITTSIFY